MKKQKETAEKKAKIQQKADDYRAKAREAQRKALDEEDMMRKIEEDSVQTKATTAGGQVNAGPVELKNMTKDELIKKIHEVAKKEKKLSPTKEELPQEALAPEQVHGKHGRIDPSEPRREFMMPPATTPRGFKFCLDRHTITLRTADSPRINAQLCGKCSDGFALLPLSNLFFKILGICYRITSLPLWARANNKRRTKYNSRSCRLFFSHKGWRYKKDYMNQLSKWGRNRQTTANKRAHGYHCVVTSLSKDDSLGEFKDSGAFLELKKRGSKIKETAVAEGWKVTFQRLKVAKFAGCYTHKQAKPALTCNKQTKTVSCQQIKVHSTGGRIKQYLVDKAFPAEKIFETTIKDDKNHFKVIVMRAASWWNKGKVAKFTVILDQSPFNCDSEESSVCREQWSDRANSLAWSVMRNSTMDRVLSEAFYKRRTRNDNDRCVRKRVKVGGEMKWVCMYQVHRCQRIGSETALSLQ